MARAKSRYLSGTRTRQGIEHMRKTEQAKLTTAIDRLMELRDVVEDRSESQHIADALEHLKYARASEEDTKENFGKQPMPHNAVIRVATSD